MSNPKSQKGRGTSSPSKKPTCGKCGKNSHKVRDFPNLKGQDKGSGKDQASGFNVDPPKKNCFNDLS